MANSIFYDQNGHQNIMLEDFGGGGLAMQANQHIIVPKLRSAWTNSCSL